MRASLLLMEIIVLLDAVIFHAMPYFSRPSIFFGVTTGDRFRESDTAAGLMRNYRQWVWLAALAAAALVGASAWGSFAPGLALGLLIQVAASTAAWIRAHRATRPYHQEAPAVREAALAVREATMPGGWPFAFGPALVMAGTFVYLTLNWDAIPGRFPIHWNAGGQADGWASRSFGGVFALPLIGMLLMLFMPGMAYLILRRTRQIAPAGAAAQNETRFKQVNAVLLIVISYMMAALFTGLATRPVWSRQEPMESVLWWLVFLPLIAILPLVFIMLRMGQGGTRLSPPSAAPMGDATPDECWKWGLIYYNPADPAFLVEKRYGYGWTFNFASKWAWIFLAAIIALPMLISGLIASH